MSNCRFEWSMALLKAFHLKWKHSGATANRKPTYELRKCRALSCEPSSSATLDRQGCSLLDDVVDQVFLIYIKIPESYFSQMILMFFVRLPCLFWIFLISHIHSDSCKFQFSMENQYSSNLSCSWVKCQCELGKTVSAIPLCHVKSSIIAKHVIARGVKKTKVDQTSETMKYWIVLKALGI